MGSIRSLMFRLNLASYMNSAPIFRIGIVIVNTTATMLVAYSLLENGIKTPSWISCCKYGMLYLILILWEAADIDVISSSINIESKYREVYI